MTNDDIVDTLNDLIETCKDGEFGFTACAKHTASSELRNIFLQRANECRVAAAELQPYVIQYGGPGRQRQRRIAPRLGRCTRLAGGLQ